MIGYVGLIDGLPVAMRGFKSQPVAGRVEIAYGTVPGQEGNGFATALASELVRITRQEDESLTVFAQTLPEVSASTSILNKLGFELIGLVEHSEDGLVWEWELPHRSRTNDSQWVVPTSYTIRDVLRNQNPNTRNSTPIV